MVTRILNCKRAVYKIQICESLGFVARKTMFRRVKAYVSSHETWSLARSNLTFRAVKAYLSEKEE